MRVSVQFRLHLSCQKAHSSSVGPHGLPGFVLQLVQTHKLKHYPSIHGGFSSDFRQPCVVFTGHPSLRFGDVVHFMELWGRSSLNTVIFTGEARPTQGAPKGNTIELVDTGL